MEQNSSGESAGSIFLCISFFICIGLVGAAENGGSMLNLLWIIPMVIIDGIIIVKDIR